MSCVGTKSPDGVNPGACAHLCSVLVINFWISPGKLPPIFSHTSQLLVLLSVYRLLLYHSVLTIDLLI